MLLNFLFDIKIIKWKLRSFFSSSSIQSTVRRPNSNFKTIQYISTFQRPTKLPPAPNVPPQCRGVQTSPGPPQPIPERRFWGKDPGLAKGQDRATSAHVVQGAWAGGKEVVRSVPEAWTGKCTCFEGHKMLSRVERGTAVAFEKSARAVLRHSASCIALKTALALMVAECLGWCQLICC